MSSRRFVHLVVDTVIGGREAYTLHRINVSSFFYPRKPATTVRRGRGRGRGGGGGGGVTKYCGTVENARLPRPALTFYPDPLDGAPAGTVEFMPLGSSKNTIVTIDQDGRAMMYGVASRALHILPQLHKPIWGPISITVGSRLYVMKSSPFCTKSGRFEALIYGHRPNMDYLPRSWYWRSLPPPPFAYVHDPSDNHQLIAGGYVDEDDGHSEITAYTVVDSDIWVSQGGKTYLFDTINSVWTNLGDWMLPFRGHVEYIPEYKLWFGLTSNGNLLCASNLNDTLRQPQLHNVWKELAPPKEWFLHESYLVPLGSSKFCIAQFFEIGRRSNFDYNERFAVFSGVEVEPGGKGGEGLHMVKHRSCRYSLNGQSYFRVF